MMTRDELAAGGLLQADWYLSRYPDIAAAGVDPLEHFLRFGGEEGRAPNPWFDPAWYLAQHPEAGPTGLQALAHYQREGDRRGLRPMPHFDPPWYRTAYALPADTLALGHFLAQRFTGRFLPNPQLYAVAHLPEYATPSGSGMDRFEHYLRDAAPHALPEIDVVARSGLVDENFYLINGSDVYDSGTRAADHFCRWGWREARQPNIYFDINWYLRTNPDVARLAINPLAHYLLEGESADCRPVPYFEPGWYRRTYVVPEGQSALAHFLANRRSQRVSPTRLFDVAWFAARHADRLGSERDPFAWYLQVGTLEDIDPSPGFNAAGYRRRHLGRLSKAFPHLMTPERHNPLVHRLRGEYR